ncbi:Archaeal primase DnaG/twinkle, TOPRIM domain [uncultured Caudovirales phage]|uniref:Archaeal primase DnaG/twinkle, TOPRIM domain n=1 Tax=uncultured Caudovirales phage TaxID=2100421 RepID=A0A6J5S0V0_9CAUD|nr:Archaeal primase DnaG/twinkle, TOPRIM domain [uncultured Caudovirales phage]
MNHTEAFRDAIAAAGLTPPNEIIGDGVIHRFSSNGRPRDEGGWYKFFDDDRPAGVFGCWRTDISVTWKSDAPRTEFTPEQKAAWKQRMQQVEAERLAERQQVTEQAAITAAEMWSQARPADHDYLLRKKIPCLGARVLGGELLIPMKHSAKELVGLQRIMQDGGKFFIKGSPLAGAYCTLGTPSASGTVVICEGYATGVSIHLATGWCVVVAFNAGNLSAVSGKICKALPTARVIIGADDDVFTDGNPGMTAAAATGLPICRPSWTGDRGRGTDFNDLHVSEGIDAVLACFQDPATLGTSGAVSDKQPIRPASDGGGQPPENSGSSGLAASFSGADAVVQDEPARPVILPGSGSDVEKIASLALVDYHTWLADTNDKGKPLSTIENVAEVCRRLGVIVRYNVISKEEEILVPDCAFSLDNKQNASLAWLISECAKFRMPVDRVPDFITYLGDQNLYNPVARWVLSTPWDGEDRLSQLIATVHAKDEANDERISSMKRSFMTRWMISAIAGAFRPNGVSAHGVLVFQGAQYVGKTKWFKQLVPQHLDLLKDGMLLRPDDRDSVMKCVSNWLVELGEIDATFRKSDVAALKSFLTSDRDVLRRAYARKESTFARRTVFFASVNPKNYLHDETGNRRYWTIECEQLDHSHGIDMQQCWAQVHSLWEAGETWFLQPDEMELLNEHNKDFEVIDPIEELITNGLRWRDGQVDWNWRSATDVLASLGRVNSTKSDVTKAGTIIRNMNGGKAKRHGQSRLLHVPDTYRTPL